ncbi:MAG: hypothetical protein LBD60_03270 [Puniceicoccales bacterium]|jgi:hypothetical protein|nr:hypothetical protein [Puniceicoccales bacterium]
MTGINSNSPSGKLLDLAIHINAKCEVVGTGHIGGIFGGNLGKIKAAEKTIGSRISNSIDAAKTLVENARVLLDRGAVCIHAEEGKTFKKLYNAWKANEATNTTTPSGGQDASQGTPSVPIPQNAAAAATPLTHKEQAVQRYVDSHPDKRQALQEGTGPLPAELQEGMQLGEIQDNLKQANSQMTGALAQALKRSEQLEVSKQDSENIKASAGLFKKEADAVMLLTQPHLRKLIEGMIHADSKAELGKAQEKKEQAEIYLARANEELASIDTSNEESLQRVTTNLNGAMRNITAAEGDIAAAQTKIANNAELSNKEFFQILARDDIEDVIRELNLGGMRSLVGLLMERLPNANFANDTDMQKVVDLISSDVFWASLKTNMTIEAIGPDGIVPDGKSAEIDDTIKQQREMIKDLIARARNKTQS